MRKFNMSLPYFEQEMLFVQCLLQYTFMLLDKNFNLLTFYKVKLDKFYNFYLYILH